MEFINGVNYVSDVSKITEVLFVIIWYLLLVCICYLSIRNMILRSSDEEDSSQKKKRKLNILKIIALYMALLSIMIFLINTLLLFRLRLIWMSSLIHMKLLNTMTMIGRSP